ncbi:MAG: PPC domain-containing protein [Planctomycetales bacterium]|nr:PPC domain-containing protein [Planctomycetales bacterium]
MVWLKCSVSLADPPVASYIFPPGGQRGTTVAVKVGGLNLHESCEFEMLGPGIEAPATIQRTKTVWFEGPIIPQPPSQASEDYPKDMAGIVKLAGDGPLGTRHWRLSTSQGATGARPFVVGDLPEVIEDEIDGEPVPVEVKLPVTINGRIFPREDVDVWTFTLRAGESVNCSAIAQRLGSPLEPRLELIGPDGRRVAESDSSDSPLVDVQLRFVAPQGAAYRLRIHDSSFGGLQNYVYRLTVTTGSVVDRAFPLGGRRGSTTKFELSGQRLPETPVEIALPAATETGSGSFLTSVRVADQSSNQFPLELDDLPEVVEQEPNELADAAKATEVPAVFNGRIGQPGDVDVWPIRATKGMTLEIDLRAARLGSPLDSVIIVTDAAGKEVAKNDDLGGGQTDSQLRFSVPADGVYFVNVAEQFSQRGGPAFAYRLRIAPPGSPAFRLRMAADALIVLRAGEAKMKVRVERLGGFAGEIQLAFDNLPPGVVVSNPKIAEKANEVDLSVKSEPAAAIGATRIVIRGTAKLAEQELTATASFEPRPGDSTGGVVDSVLLAIALPTPFKAMSDFETRYAARGSVLVKHYRVERNGYEGPLEVQMGDRQGRHLQGVVGPTITVPAGVSEFDYPVFLPPWMEIGRTSRSQLSVAGTIIEPDGRKHVVNFSSNDQNMQIIALVDPGSLGIEADKRSLAVSEGRELLLQVRVSRGQGTANLPVKVELIVPAHVRGVSAESISIPADQAIGTITFRCVKGESLGPFNAPVLLRATAMKPDNKPVVAEAKIELVP